MPWDPVLAAHAIAPFCFEVGGDLSPASIRDQMVRSRMLVDRVIREDLVDAAGKDLLVVGAGASGITTAIHAASRGVRTVVVEKEPVAFSRQRLCLTRDVDPTLYDWPVDHWPLGRFPWAGPPMPLPWRADRGNAVALGWELRLRRAIALYGRLLDVRFDTAPAASTAAPAVGGGGLLEVDLVSRTGPATNEEFGALVSCVGFGRERCSEGPYRGHAFWESDLLEHPNLGLGGAAARVVVSGGGDGAIQDFVRAVTGKGARHVYETLRNADPPVGEALDLAERAIHSAEDQAQRALVWNVGAPDDDAVLDHLESAHAGAVDVLATSAAWPDLGDLLAGLVRVPRPEVVIAHKGARFGRCYALNRFLALLFLRMAQDRGLPIARVPNVELTGVGGHACTDPATCHGQYHDVVFAPEASAAPGTTGFAGRFNVVVIRHGILGPLNLILPRSTVNRRHTLPYHLPA